MERLLIRISYFLFFITVYLGSLSYAFGNYNYDLSFKQTIRNDSLIIDVLVHNSGDPLAFGTSNFVFNIDTSAVDVSKMKILTYGPWSSYSNSSKYNPLLLGYFENYVVVNVDAKTSPTIGPDAYSLLNGKDTLIVRLQMPIKNCSKESILRWRQISPTGDIKAYGSSISIRDRATFIDSSSVTLCSAPMANLTASPGTTILISTPITFTVNFTPSDAAYDKIEFYVDNILKQSGTSKTYSTLASDTISSVYAKVYKCACSRLTNEIILNVVECDSSWTGLDAEYCTSSPLSILKPKIPGGIFKGPGVYYASALGFYYFKPADAGFGNVAVTYIASCGDSLTKTTYVKPAPCITTANQDSANGFTYTPKPQGIYTDCNGEIYTTSGRDYTIIKIDTFGIKHVIAGKVNNKGYIDGDTSMARFNNPLGLVVDNTVDKNVYIVDNDALGFTIRVLNQRTTTVRTLAGGPIYGAGNTSDDGIGTAAKFIKAVGICFDSSRTKLFVTESDDSRFVYRIREINIATGYVKTIAGGPAGDVPSAPGIKVDGVNARFRGLGHISADGKYLYVTDPVLHKIKKINFTSPTYEVEMIVGNGLGFKDGNITSAQFNMPISASVGVNGNILVVDKGNHSIRQVTQLPNVNVTTIAGTGFPGNDESSFNNPVAASVFVKGFIDIVDLGNDRIRRVAIADYGSLPFKGLKSPFCQDDIKDTLEYVLGIYSGPGVIKENGRWYFSPAAVNNVPGKYTISYSYDLNTCNASFYHDVYIAPNPKPYLGSNIDTTICDNTLGSFKLDGGSFATYKWYKGVLPGTEITSAQNQRYLTINSVGQYSVIVSDTNGCIGESSIEIRMQAVPPVYLGRDTTLCAGSTLSLVPKIITIDTSLKIDTALWQDSTFTIDPNLGYSVTGGGVYVVNTKYNSGCISSDTINILAIMPPTPLITSSPAENCMSYVGTEKVITPGSTGFLVPKLKDLVKDKAGNAYITDYENKLIYKMDINKNISVFAGGGGDPQGTSLATVKLAGPYGITIDKFGSLYVSEVDAEGHVIRKITPDGKVSIYAGVLGNPIFNGNGRRDTIHLNRPTGLDFDDAGNLYVAEFSNNIIRIISPLGYTKMIGSPSSGVNKDGPFSSASFFKPHEVSVDKSGYVFVGDLSGAIRKVDPFKKMVSTYSTPGNDIRGLALDSWRKMYASRWGTTQVVYINPKDSTNSVYAGKMNTQGIEDGNMLEATFMDVQGLYIAEEGGPLYVVDNDRIRIITDSCRTSICEGNNAILTVNGIYNNYSWRGRPADEGKNTIETTAGGSYFVTVTDQNKCSFYDSIQINVIPKPVITLSKDTTICQDGIANLLATIAPNDTGAVVKWILNGIVEKQTKGSVSNLLTSKPGTYTVEVVTSEQCTYSLQVSVGQSIPAVTATADRTDICIGETTNLMATPTAGVAPFYFSWNPYLELDDDSISNPLATPVMEGSREYTVLLTDWKGCQAKSRVMVNVNPKAIVDFSYNYACLGDSTKFKFLGPGNITRWAWDFGDVTSGSNNISSQRDPSHLYQDTGSFIVNLEVTYGFNCATAISKTVNLKPTPISDFSFTTATCGSDSVSFKDNSSIEAGALVRWSWDFGDLATTSDTSNLRETFYKYPSAGPFDVRLTTYSDLGCSHSVTKIINLNPNNNLNPSIEIQEACIGDSTVFLDKSAPINGYINSWVWDFGDPVSGLANTSSIKNPKHLYSGSGPYSVRLAVTDNYGCKDTIVEIVTPRVKPIADFTHSTGCIGQVVSFTNGSIANSGTISNSYWDFGDPGSGVNDNSTAVNPSHIFAGAGPFTVTMVTVNSDGCKDTITRLVSLNPQPKAAFYYSASDCGTSGLVNFSNNSSGVIGYNKWDFGLVGVLEDTSNQSSPTFTYPGRGPYSVSLVVTSNLGCKDTLQQIVDLNQSINAGFIYSPTCIGDTIFFQDTTKLRSGNIVSWKWDFGDPLSTNNTSTLPNPMHLYNGNGPYVVTMTVTSNLNCTNSYSTNLSIHSKPVAAFTNALPCSSDSILFTDGSAPGIVSRKWSFGDSSLDSISLKNSPKHLFKRSGTFNVGLVVTDNNGCKDTINKSVLVNPSPVADFIPKATVCPAIDSVVFENNSLGNIAAYKWNFGEPSSSNNTSSLKDPKHKYSIVGKYTVYLNVETSIGCKDSTSKLVDLDSKNIFANFGYLDSCSVDSIAFFDNSILTSGSIIKREWNFGDVNSGVDNLSTIERPKHKFSAPGTYTASLTITTNLSCTNTVSKVLNVFGNPVINVSSRDSSLCFGDTTSLFVKIANPSPGKYQYRWSSGNALNDPAIANPVSKPATTTRFAVEVKDINGCFALNSVLISVSSPPVISLSPSQTICPNTSYKIILGVSGKAPFDFAWTPSINLDDPNVQSPIATPTINTPYNVVVTDSNGCERTGAISIIIRPTTVDAIPDFGLCDSLPASLSATSIGAGKIQYNWSPSVDLNRNDSSVVIAGNLSIGNHKFWVNVIDELGCQDLDSVNVTIHPLPKAVIDSTEINVCFGDSVRVGGRPTATGGSGNLAIRWNSLPQSISTINHPDSLNPYLKPIATAWYFAKVMDQNNCSATDSVLAIVNPLPDPFFSQDKANACLGEALTLISIPQNGQMGFQWIRVSPDSLMSTTSTVQVFKTGLFRFVLKNQTTQCRDSSEKLITFISPPSNPFITGSDTSCNNVGLPLLGTATGDNLKFKWSHVNGQGVFSSDTLASSIYIPDSLDTNPVTFILDVSNACDTASTAHRVIFNPAPFVSFNANPLVLFIEEPVTFSNTTDTVGQEIISLWWDFRDGSKDSSYHTSHAYSNTGLYNVNLIAINEFGCRDTASQVINVSNAQVLYIPNVFSPKISQNPNENGVLKVYGKNISNNDFVFQVFNRWGEVVYYSKDFAQASSHGWNGKLNNSGEEMPLGVYTFSVRGKYSDGTPFEKNGTISLIR